MSPEIFKCFVHQLSEDLNSIKDVAVPILNENEITHLLWADDLILLALDKENQQKMLNILLTYCAEWGLSVNLGPGKSPGSSLEHLSTRNIISQ